MTEKPPQPLDEQGVYEATFGAFRSVMKLHAEESLPIITGETLAIFRELSKISLLIWRLTKWVMLGVCALVAIAVKLWFF